MVPVVDWAENGAGRLDALFKSKQLNGAPLFAVVQNDSMEVFLVFSCSGCCWFRLES